MKELLEKANVVGDIIIISDANTLYIDTITKAKGIRDCFHSVITNPTVIEGSKVSIKRRGQSSCPNSCAVNICKGKELLDFLAVNGPYDQICYIGDGLNDFCPGTKLKETDLFFPRNGFKLSSKLKNEVFRSQIVAKVYEWTDASDLKAYLERELPVFQ
jgi:pyridoxal phosphate phosphatase PHOSPHO2